MDGIGVFRCIQKTVHRKHGKDAKGSGLVIVLEICIQ